MEDNDSGWKIFFDFLKTCLTIFIAVVIHTWRWIVPKKRKIVSDKIVLITGAGQGIGQRLAVLFAKLGSTVVLWDINSGSLETSCDLIEKTMQTQDQLFDVSSKVYSYTCDVGKKEEVYETAKRVKKEVGAIDILINNAGIVNGRSLLDTEDEKIIKIFKVNLLSHFWTVKSFLPDMLARNSGHVVSMASSLGYAPINQLLDYSVTKFGVIGFSEVLNYENIFSGYEGIKVTTVCPSLIKTGMFGGCSIRSPTLLPDLDPDETAEIIVDGILREKDFMYIPDRCRFLHIAKGFLPQQAWIEILKYMRTPQFMDSFQGSSNT